jgi:tight adherence protein B
MQFVEMFIYAAGFVLILLFWHDGWLALGRFNQKQALRLSYHFKGDPRTKEPKKVARMLLWAEIAAFVFATAVGLNPFFGLWGFGFALFATSYTVKLLDMREISRFDDQMIDVTFAFKNSLKAGMTLQQSMQMISNEFTAPASEQFRIVLREIQVGASVEEGLHHLEERMPNNELKMMVNAIEILRQTGGNMVETFATLSETLKNRKRVEGKIKSLTAQGRIQALMLCGMPFAMMLILYFLSRSYIMPLFNHPLGWITLTIVVILVATGWMLIKKLITIEV